MCCRAWACATLLLLFSAGSAFGGFVTSVTGNGVLVSPPASVVPGAAPANEYVVFQEQSGVLTSAVTLDESGADQGGHDGTSTLVPITLPAGTHYATTFVNLDPEESGKVNSGSAVIHFSTQILGIALRSATLDGTDIFGHPGTTYPTGNSARGLEFTKDDKFTIAGNGKNLELNFTANNFDFDQIRIFTAAPTSVPEPSTLLVWLTTSAFLGVVVLRRGKRPIAV